MVAKDDNPEKMKTVLLKPLLEQFLLLKSVITTILPSKNKTNIMFGPSKLTEVLV